MDELEAIRLLGADVPLGDGEAKNQALQRLRRHALGTDALGRSPRRHRSRWVVATAAVALTLVLSGVLLNGEDDREPTAARTLHDLVLVAAQQSRLVPPPGTYVYVRSEQLRRVGGEVLGAGSGWTALVRLVRQEWRAADGSGRILTVAVGNPRFVSPGDEAAWRRAGRPEILPRAADDRYRAGDLPTPDLHGLPRDVGALRGALEQRSVVDGPPGVAETFNIIGMLLEEQAVPPDLRASLLEVAASLPGVRVINGHLDPLGRRSLAVTLTHGHERTNLDFDAATSVLLATERYRLPSTPEGTAADWQAFWPPRIVDSLRNPSQG
ncbi:MAG: CU044_5270 family protein [Actinomycetota bacterium]